MQLNWIRYTCRCKNNTSRCKNNTNRCSHYLSKPQSISNVGSAEADSILLELQSLQVDGNLDSPIVVPAGEPSCSPFDYSQHLSENAGTPVLLKHHEHHLGLFGVLFGRSGFQMHDVHSRSNDLKLIALSSGQQYNEGVDGIVAPYALTKAGAFTEMRTVCEHKQSIAQKQLYREANPSQFKVSASNCGITCHRFLSQVVTSAYGGSI